MKTDLDPATEAQTDTSTEPQSAAPDIPKELSDQWGAVQACATAFNCLDKAYLPHSYHDSVKQSLIFLMKLHEQSVEVCLKHKDAGKIPELKKIVDAQKKRERKAEKKNGQEKH